MKCAKGAASQVRLPSTRSASTRARVGAAVRHVEPLEQLLLRAADPVISEFMAKNSGSLLDAFGNESDWIEIHNQGDAPVQLQGWHLTDDISQPAKWTFPSKTLAAGARMVVFASSLDTVDSAGNLHTNFSLSQEGERLALVKPDLTVVSAFGTSGNFPPQFADVSYGIGRIYDNTNLIGSGANVKAFVPTNGSIDDGTWVNPSFNDSTWLSGTGGVGFETGQGEDNSPVPVLKANWDADTLGVRFPNNGAVTNWSSTIGSGITANASGTTANTRPTFRTNQINGHAAVQFTPGNGAENLRLDDSVNPLAGANDFTIALVYRATATLGDVTATSNWNSHAGIIDTEAGASANDWGISIANGGQIAAGTGAPSKSVYDFQTNSANGAAHVVVFTRKAGTMSVYVDGGNGVGREDGNEVARSFTDLVFGSLQTDANYFTGDIAQVMLYDGWMDLSRAYNTSLTLGAKYGVSIAEPPESVSVQLQAQWTADALNAAGDGNTVGSWTSTAQSVTRTAAVSGAPKLESNELNGHSVVRFNAADGSDRFRLPAASNPAAGRASFTAAFVYRSSAVGRGITEDWYANTGIIDASVAGTTQADWGIGINSVGQVGGGVGNPDDTVYSQAGLNDGRAHVVVFSKAGTTMRLSIDGGEPRQLPAGAAGRTVTDLVFGGLQTETAGAYFTGDLAEVRLYSGNVDPDAAYTISSEMASTYGIPLVSSPYSPYIGLDIRAQMSNLASTAAVRYPFTVNDPAQFDRLQLSMQYDDGFVAYLNGTEVARRNAPNGAISYTSTSVRQRIDPDAIAGELIDISAFRNLLVGNGATNVLAIRALNLSSTDGDLLIAPKLIAGRTTTNGPVFFNTPTPGTANVEGFLGVADSPTFSKSHGYYTGTQSLTVSAGSVGGTLIYTTNGSEPSLTNGTVVLPGSPTVAASTTLSLTKTTTIRAITVRNMYLTSPVTAQSYMFTDSLASQVNTAPSGAYWGSGIDPRFFNGTLPDQGFSVADAVKSLPTISISMDRNELFGPDGLYLNPLQTGRDWERETSIEYFDPRAPTNPGFTLNAGIRIQGGAGRHTGIPKRSFRIYFRSEYGVGSLDYPLFRSGAATTNHDKFVLRGGHNYSWAGDNNAQSEFLRDQFGRRLQAQMTGSRASAVDGTFVHLYLNGEYWGLYALDEDPDDTWAANHFGGEPTDYEVVEPDNNGGMELKSDPVYDANGNETPTLYSQLFALLESSMSNASISNAEYDAIKTKVDIESLVDYMLNTVYRGDGDAPTVITNTLDPRNFYAYVNRADGHYKFAAWDGEWGMTNVNANETEVSADGTGGHDNPGRLWVALRTNAEFRQYVSDRIYKHFYNGGALQVAAGVNKPLDLYNSMVPDINAAVVGESARWGTAHQAYPRLRVNDYLTALSQMRTYLANRTAVVLGQLTTDFPMIARLPATYRIGATATRGGKVTPGTAVTLFNQNTNTTGDQIFYTLNGTDPRGVGGTTLGTLYTGPITINATQTISVRVKNGTTWSPMDQVNFSVDSAANASNLTISEIHYHPANITAAETALLGAAATEDDFDYIELMNTSLGPVSLLGLSWTGITLAAMTENSVAAGERVVIVRNLAAFQARFGTGPRVVGVFTGTLSNSGETISVRAADTSVIRSVAYTDGSTGDGWATRADGNGSSLEIIDINGNYNSPTNWRASYAYEGTPGAVARVAPAADVVINEIIAAADDGIDRVELYNGSAAAVNIGGWSLSDENGVDYFIPAGTILPAGGYYVSTSVEWAAAGADLGLGGASGDDLFLIRSVAGVPSGFAEAIHFGSSALGESFARTPNGSGAFYPTATPTPGIVNAAPRIGPATITEVMFKPVGGNLNLQYVEVQNQTGAALDISGWKFDSGIALTIAAGTVLAAFEPVLFVRFNPTIDTAAADAFRSAYGLTTSTRLIGPFTGDLSTLGEQLRLVRTEAPRPSEPTVTPVILVDEFTYGISSPWPTVAVGQALTRVSNKVYGPAATNWASAAPSAGTVDYGNAWFAGSAARVFNGSTSFDSLTIDGTGASLALGADAVLRVGAIALLNGAKFDVGSGTLLIDYSAATPAAGMRTMLINGYNGGAWNGSSGLTSSVASANANHTLGWAEATSISAAIRSTFSSDPIDDTTVIVRYTRVGDANLDRTVNFDDLLALARNYNATSGKSTAEGELNYDTDGSVSFDDLLALARNYNASAVVPPAALQATVPTPRTTRARASSASAVIS